MLAFFWSKVSVSPLDQYNVLRGGSPLLHVAPCNLFGARATRPLAGLISPKDGCASIA
ncbi:MAG TPA: hypothetical protein PK677_17705 [Acidiphilium sp.]|nr:hypothetical protein [Acidiphilium sp.]